MTIVEAAKKVLETNADGMTSAEIYEAIIEQGLYIFGAKTPIHVVNYTVRKHCFGLDFPNASPVKYFKVEKIRGKRIQYALLDDHKPTVEEHQQIDNTADQVPEEIIQNAHNQHIALIKENLIDVIMEKHPSFFERLVIDLLLKMGYGHDKDSGVVVGGSHDGGIDGVIYEDKLGLNTIYIQAKRYKRGNNVGCPELQAFVGAMENVNKGVFITTSTFTKEAQRYAKKQQQKNLKLIDGDLLTQLMIKYEVGVAAENAIKLYRIDTTYFE